MKVLERTAGVLRADRAIIARFEHDLGQGAVRFGDFKKPNLASWPQLGERPQSAVATVTKEFLLLRAYAEQFSTSSGAMKVIGEGQGRVPPLDRRLLLNASRSTSTASFPAAANFLCGRGAASSSVRTASACSTCRPVVESLATSTNGRASVFVTSQADLEGITCGEEKVACR